MKKILVVTGGAGFVGSNLIEYILKNTKYSIISIDNYSSGKIKNHIFNKRILYIKGNTKNIDKILSSKAKRIKAIFHFGEFARIHQSFNNFDKCLDSNIIGTRSIINFCQKNNIRLIYSATSATLGNNGADKNLSPYAFSKSHNLELLENMKKWFDFKFEIVYFYNVYGPRHIEKGEMATVIGIFENQYKNSKPLTVVRPGSQSRRFTHVFDTVKICYEAFVANKCCHYSIFHKKTYSIIEVAKMFKSKIKYIDPRLGERNSSAIVSKSLSNKIIKRYGKIKLKDYINSSIKG
jgi:UDP-glucose 4-epimerase